MTSKSLIVGATGSLGPSVIKALKEKGQQIRILIRDKSKAQKYFGNDPDIEIVQGSAIHEETVETALQGCSHLFYLVNTPYNKWTETSLPLLTASINAAIKRNAKIVFPGNVYNYGYAKYNPVDEKHPWNAHTNKGKIRIELEGLLKKAREEKGLKYTITRMPDFYGPFVINTFSEKAYINALYGKKLQWIGNLDVKTEYIFIEDAGKAMVIAGLSDKSDGEEYNVPAYSPITSREYLEEIVKLSGTSSKIISLNSDFIFTVGGLFSPLIKEVKEMLYLKREELVLDGSKFKEAFGEIPTRNYKDGVTKTLDWVKDFYNL